MSMDHPLSATVNVAATRAVNSPPPPRWKMAILTATGLYPLVLWLFPYLATLTADLAPWLGKLLTVLLAVPLMSWGVLPLLTRIFRNWLYPALPKA